MDEEQILKDLDWTAAMSCEWLADHECQNKPEWIVLMSCGCTRYVCNEHLFNLVDLVNKTEPLKSALKKKFLDAGYGDVDFNIFQLKCPVHDEKCYIKSWTHIEDITESDDEHGLEQQ
jgi:hypothetical protein